MRNPEIFKYSNVECGGTAKAKAKAKTKTTRRSSSNSSSAIFPFPPVRSFHILLLRSQAHHSRLPVFHLLRSPRRNPHRDLPPIPWFRLPLFLSLASISEISTSYYRPHFFSRFCTEHLNPISSQVVLNLVE